MLILYRSLLLPVFHSALEIRALSWGCKNYSAAVSKGMPCCRWCVISKEDRSCSYLFNSYRLLLLPLAAIIYGTYTAFKVLNRWRKPTQNFTSNFSVEIVWRVRNWSLKIWCNTFECYCCKQRCKVFQCAFLISLNRYCNSHQSFTVVHFVEFIETFSSSLPVRF